MRLSIIRRYKVYAFKKIFEEVRIPDWRGYEKNIFWFLTSTGEFKKFVEKIELRFLSHNFISQYNLHHYGTNVRDNTSHLYNPETIEGTENLTMVNQPFYGINALKMDAFQCI